MRTSNARRAVLAALLFAALAMSACERSELGYDAKADPFAALETARAAAAAEGKLVLVVAGGDWCIWCHYLDAFLHDNADIGAAFKDTFVVTKIYVGEDNENTAFFSTMPEAAGYPHFWVVDADGTMLASEGTLPLEDGNKSYDREKFKAFIEKWRTALPAGAKSVVRLHAPRGLI